MRRTIGRRSIGLGICGAMLAAAAAAAAQPQVEQRNDVERRNELRRIIDLPALRGLGPISKIERITGGHWQVTAGPCVVDVYVVERRRIGVPNPPPPTYTPRAGQPVCRR